MKALLLKTNHVIIYNKKLDITNSNKKTDILFIFQNYMFIIFN